MTDTRVVIPTDADPGEAFRCLGEGLAALVFHPDYYAGPWSVSFYSHARQRSLHRKCSSYTVAEAWAKYLRRHGYRLITLRKL